MTVFVMVSGWRCARSLARGPEPVCSSTSLPLSDASPPSTPSGSVLRSVVDALLASWWILAKNVAGLFLSAQSCRPWQPHFIFRSSDPDHVRR